MRDAARGSIEADPRWRAVLDGILADPDPVRANRAITQAHHDLSVLLDDCLGGAAGANFHTWAVWGSREAGTTIDRRDISGLLPRVALLTGSVALVVAVLFAGAHPSTLVTTACAALLGALVTQHLLDRASDHISHGNRMVLDEIGGATATFVEHFAHGDPPYTDALERFLTTLRPGPSASGGQDALRAAFTAYHQAMHEPDPKRRHELVFAANCLAVRHEHVRLQTDIAGAIPRLLRRWITRSQLDFQLGAEPLHVSRDLTPVDGTAYPAPLAELHEPVAVEIAARMRPGPSTERPLRGSGARDWTDFDQRMVYIVELFRSRHLAPQVFDPPWPDPEGTFQQVPCARHP